MLGASENKNHEGECSCKEEKLLTIELQN